MIHDVNHVQTIISLGLFFIGIGIMRIAWISGGKLSEVINHLNKVDIVFTTIVLFVGLSFTVWGILMKLGIASVPM